MRALPADGPVFDAMLCATQPAGWTSVVSPHFAMSDLAVISPVSFNISVRQVHHFTSLLRDHALTTRRSRRFELRALSQQRDVPLLTRMV
jgi:hypothetical protein